MTQTQTETGLVEAVESTIVGVVGGETVTDTEPTVEELLAAREELDRRIKATIKLQRPADLATCRKLVGLHGFTARDLGIVEPVGVVETIPSAATARADGETAKKVPVKYRNAETGDTWTGRGIQPKWLQQALAEGKSLADFLVPAESAEAEA